MAEYESKTAGRESRYESQQLSDLKREVKRLSERIEGNYDTMTQLMANYKMFRQSVEDRISQMDDDGRQFERATADWGEGVVEVLEKTETEQSQNGQNAFTAMIQQVLEADLVAREKKLREEFGRNPKSSGKKESSGDGLGITFVLSVINFIAVGYLFIHIFKIF